MLAVIVVLGFLAGCAPMQQPIYPSPPPLQTVNVSGTDGSWTLEIHLQACEVFAGTLTNNGRLPLAGMFKLIFVNRAANQTTAQTYYRCDTALPGGGTSTCTAILPAYNCMGADAIMVNPPPAGMY